MQARYADSERERDWPIQNVAWEYPELGPNREPSVEAVLKEMNGYDTRTGAPPGSPSQAPPSLGSAPPHRRPRRARRTHAA